MSPVTIQALMIKIANEQAKIAEVRKVIYLTSRDLGQLLRQERVQARVSLRALARAMDISAPYLADLENGRRVWSIALADSYLTWLKRAQEAP